MFKVCGIFVISMNGVTLYVLKGWFPHSALSMQTACTSFFLAACWGSLSLAPPTRVSLAADQRGC